MRTGTAYKVSFSPPSLPASLPRHALRSGFFICYVTDIIITATIVVVVIVITIIFFFDIIIIIKKIVITAVNHFKNQGNQGINSLQPGYGSVEMDPWLPDVESTQARPYSHSH